MTNNRNTAITSVFLAMLALLICQKGYSQSYTISPNGYICSSTTTATLSGSQTGVYYQFATANISGTGTYYSSWISGTGSAISWSNVPATGTCVVYGQASSSTPTTNGSGSVVASGAIYYQSPPNISLTAGGTTALTPGSSVTLTANITPTSTETGPWTYMWFSNGRPIQGAPNASTYTANAAGNYSVDIVGNCSGQMTNTIVVTAIMAPGVISPATQTANSNVAGTILTGTTPAVWSGTYTYQWQSSTDEVNWSNISTNGTSQNYTPLPQTTTVYYRREVINGTNIGYSNTAAVIVGYADLLNTNLGHSYNYILTSTPRVKGITTNAELINQTTANLMQSVEYFDGLGRLIQSIQIKGSPQFNDLVQPVGYDALGREAITYLPYSSSVNDGSYKADALETNSGQAAFYASPPIGSGISSIAEPYAVVGFEPSPLNRKVEQGFPGTAWQISGTAASNNTDHTVKTDYTTNDQTSTFNSTILSNNPGSKIVALYTATINADNSRTLVRTNNNATYSPGKLQVIITKDENWQPGDGCIGTTERYTDFDGRLVLKRTYNLKTVGTTQTVEMLSTYYVYDNFNNLAFVLTPAANPDANAAIAQTTLNSLCYQYQYDSRNRLSGKRLPGKDWEYTVYNILDQPVATQDGNQRTANEWVITKYDEQGRPIMTALWTNAGIAISQSALQAILTPLTTNLWETTTTTGIGYTNVAWPTSSISQKLTLNYYDGYTAPGIPANFTAPTGAATDCEGLLTATQTNVLGTTDMLWASQYYDNLARIITTYKQHYFGGAANVNNYDQINTTYNFNNQITTTTRYHHNTSNTASVILTIGNRYIYDQVGRKTNTWEQIQNGTATPDTRTLISQNVYNEIGQLLTLNLHNTTDSTHFFQSINYTYNERGWLLSSNAPLFTEELQYNNNVLNLTGFTPQYNGNIASMTRVATINNPTTLSYSYNYDRLNRLIQGISTDGNNEKGIVYDQNGNITALQRTGVENDNLTYTYENSGLSNQINTISNIAGTNSGLPNGLTTYNSYDANGNTLYDGRNATNVQYNLLNLPQSVTAKNITYIYDATGRKLRRIDGTNHVTTEYLDGIEYDGGTLTFIKTDEGQAIPNGTSFNYEYSLVDHLGSVRVLFDTGSGIARQEQQNDYYPFGLTIARNTPATADKYLYNGKEQQDLLNQYDYGARFYDPVIARWTSIDPDAEDFKTNSPYIYGENNPISMIDRNGMESTDSQKHFSQSELKYFQNVQSNILNDINDGNSNSSTNQEDLGSSSLPFTETTVSTQSDTSGKGNNDGSKSRNPSQDKKLTPGDIKNLQEQGWDHREKGDHGGQTDLFKDKEGNVYQKPKNGKGPGEPIGYNLNDNMVSHYNHYVTPGNHHHSVSPVAAGAGIGGIIITFLEYGGWVVAL